MSKKEKSPRLHADPLDDVDWNLTPLQTLEFIKALQDPPLANADLKALMKRKPSWTEDDVQ